MKRAVFSLIAVVVILTACQSKQAPKTLKQAFADKFLVGVAIDTVQALERSQLVTQMITNQFNAIVAENCMKSESIQPQEGVFDFTHADNFVKFGEKYNMVMTGHCLIWHSQAPKWFFTDSTGAFVSREVMIERMRNHIFTIMTHYKGKMKGWDVVNEAIEDDGSWRKSEFYNIIGEDYIKLAFQFAHEADPDVELYYNDYGMAHEARRNKTVELIKSLKNNGLRIDAVGMQGHMGMDHPDFNEFEKSIEAFAATGVKVMITEWDMSALPTLREGANVTDTMAYRANFNPYPTLLPDSVATIWNNRMECCMDMFMKHSDVISRVTMWGLSDNESWRNYWPVEGRVDYPTYFNRDYQPKPFLKKYLNK